jgi:rubrerythrin
MYTGGVRGGHRGSRPALQSYINVMGPIRPYALWRCGLCGYNVEGQNPY